MDKFEYRILREYIFLDSAEEKWLNGLGQNGWELCVKTYDNEGTYYIFKRKIDKIDE